MTLLSDAEVYAMIDELGDVGAAIERARPDSLARLYRDLGIEVSYRHAEDGGLATIALRVVSGCVRVGLAHFQARRLARSTHRQPDGFRPAEVDNLSHPTGALGPLGATRGGTNGVDVGG